MPLNCLIRIRMIYKNSYKIIDISKSENESYKEKFKNFILNEIPGDNHFLSTNYVELYNKLDHFLCFLLVINENDQILSFEGMQIEKHFPSRVARVMSRRYVPSKHRLKVLATKESLKNSIYLNLTLPYQLDLADKLNLNGVFFSLNQFKRKRVAKAMEEVLVSHNFNFILLDGLFNVCRTYNDNGLHIGVNPSDKCWQRILWLPLKPGARFDRPQKNE